MHNFGIDEIIAPQANEIGKQSQSIYCTVDGSVSCHSL